MSFTAERREAERYTHTQGHKRSIKISSPFIFVALFVIPVQVVHTFLVSEEVTEQSMLCRSRRPLFRNQMQQMRSSLSLTLPQIATARLYGVLTLYNSLIKDRFQQGNYSCPPSCSPCRSECHEFHNFSSGHDMGGGQKEEKIKERGRDRVGDIYTHLWGWLAKMRQLSLFLLSLCIPFKTQSSMLERTEITPTENVALEQCRVRAWQFTGLLHTCTNTENPNEKPQQDTLVTLWEENQELEPIKTNKRETWRVEGERSRAYFSRQQLLSQAGGKKPRGPHPQINEFTDRRAAEGHRGGPIYPHEKPRRAPSCRRERLLIMQPHQNDHSDLSAFPPGTSSAWPVLTVHQFVYNTMNKTHCGSKSKGGC